MHGHALALGLAIAGLVIGAFTLLFQVLTYRNEKR
jgi:hypothetical protein